MAKHACGVPTRGTIISGRTLKPWLFTEIAASKMARTCISVSSGYDIPSLKHKVTNGITLLQMLSNSSESPMH